VVGQVTLEAIVAHHLPHHRAILLFHIALVVLAIRAPPREGDLGPCAVLQQGIVKEFAPIVGVQTPQREGEEVTRLVEGVEHIIVAMMQERQTRGPPGGHSGEHERREVGSLRACAAVRYRSGFHEPRTHIVPLGKGANGHLVFEQRARLGRADPTRPGALPHRSQQPISRGRT